MGSYLVKPGTNQPFSEMAAPNGTTLTAGALGRVPTGSGAATIYLPASPGDGQPQAIVDVDGSAAANPITINGNGTNIDGASTLLIATDNAEVVFVYDATGGQWRRVVPERVFESYQAAADERTVDLPWPSPMTFRGTASYSGGEVAAPNGFGQTVANNAGNAHLCVWSSAYNTPTIPEVLGFGSDFSGNASSQPDWSYLWAKQLTQLGTGSGTGDAAIYSFKSGGDPTLAATGVAAGPNLAILNNTAVNFPSWTFGGGTGVQYFQVSAVEPNPGTTPPQSGVHLWIKPATYDLWLAKPDGSTVNLSTPAAGTFAFAADANETLTAQKSAFSTLVVQNGTITAPRQITSARAPATSNQQLIANRNAFDVTFKWSSGATVTIPTGTWALVGSDGTDAIILAS